MFLLSLSFMFLFFFFNVTATTEIYTLSLHDALPISRIRSLSGKRRHVRRGLRGPLRGWESGGSPAPVWPARARLGFVRDRKSTRLNSSHRCISYAVFCLKKKKKQNKITHR